GYCVLNPHCFLPSNRNRDQRLLSVNPRRRQLRPKALAKIVTTYSSVQEGSGACLLMSAWVH
ncbi:MAG: hypothetical protein WAL01_00020, partial [Pseudolabrys sp.]